MAANESNTGDLSDREIVHTRLLDAPRELVWEAWTDPRHVAQWWGPNGFTNTIQEMNVTPGGVWRLVMHGPDGTDYPNRMTFHEVVRPERLVYSHDSDQDDDENQFHVTVTLDDEGGKTRLVMRALFASAAARAKVVEEYGAIEGGTQTLNHLEQFLAQQRKEK